MSQSMETSPSRRRLLDALAPGGRRMFFLLAVCAVCLLFAFPVLWLVLTSLRPGYAVYYVHRGLDFTLANYGEALEQSRVAEAFFNSAVIATLATILSLGVTVSSGYMLSRFSGRTAKTWFGLIYVARCIPYISWVLPLFFVTRAWGVYDTYVGLLLPHVAVHTAFFSWIMKGFFDSIDPSMEYAAMIDGCTRWGAFFRVALPAAVPGMAALGILSWLFTWNEFLFALILTGSNTPVITVIMAQFVQETGTAWNLMSATAVMAIAPAIVITVFGQRYVVRGLRL